MPFDEVKEIIALPAFDPSAKTIDPDTIVLSPVVERQLKGFVAGIASMYQDNRKFCALEVSTRRVSISQVLTKSFLASSSFSLQLSTTLSMRRTLPCQ
jgi:hypothetical protein